MMSPDPETTASILKESMSILGENTYEALKFHMKERYGIDLAHNPRLEDVEFALRDLFGPSADIIMIHIRRRLNA
ncbi:hypothetical protein [Nitrososphaera viennensis]|uniref:Uncharacterized protein n=2 Tax=Nitrososphaera viennensis TaxID=1034015 RepID=A0A060HHC0_9ARCH|nr:hypothetical protein [Nitrososphaera viennensis]AIC14938.1 hypothetical protein NVIE_007280 [Nitrososphaera viennensis EN76]UVS69877.1 hypothetical protein NWT39_03595 [Nitrososphaera viennensis]